MSLAVHIPVWVLWVFGGAAALVVIVLAAFGVSVLWTFRNGVYR